MEIRDKAGGAIGGDINLGSLGNGSRRFISPCFTGAFSFLREAHRTDLEALGPLGDDEVVFGCGFFGEGSFGAHFKCEGWERGGESVIPLARLVGIGSRLLRGLSGVVVVVVVVEAMDVLRCCELRWLVKFRDMNISLCPFGRRV